MEAGVIRIMMLISLFLILTADYSTLLGHLLEAMGFTAPTDKTKSNNAVKSVPLSGLDDSSASHTIPSSRLKLMSTMKESCLPKLICELNSSPNKDKLTESEKALLSLIRETSVSVRAEVTSKYHFAAHMGQLIAGVEGTGCHNFYPSCPFPGLQVLHMMKKVKIR